MHPEPFAILDCQRGERAVRSECYLAPDQAVDLISENQPQGSERDNDERHPAARREPPLAPRVAQGEGQPEDRAGRDAQVLELGPEDLRLHVWAVNLKGVYESP